MTNPLEAAGFVPVSNDYSSPKTIARIREALIANTYDSDDGEYDGTATPDIQSVSLPWWVWDDIFGALLRCSDDDSDALAHILYPESGPLNDIKHLIEGPSFVNMITLAK